MRFTPRPFSERSANWLAQSGVHPLLAKLYAARGIENPKLLSLDLKELIPPKELKNCLSTASILADILLQKRPLLESKLLGVNSRCRGAAVGKSIMAISSKCPATKAADN